MKQTELSSIEEITDKRTKELASSMLINKNINITPFIGNINVINE